MAQFAISTSSTADLPENYYEDHDIGKLCFTFQFHTHEYDDDFARSMPASVFYNRLRNGEVSHTSMVNAGRFEAYFKSILDSGRSLLHIEFSSALSGSYQCAAAVAKKLNAQYEDVRVVVIDSLSASLGLGLIVDKARRFRDSGKTLEETAAWVEENKLRFIHWFTVTDLDYLKRGGRIKPSSAFFGNMLKIKPVMDMDDRGRLIPLYKARGRKKSIRSLFEHVEEDIVESENDCIFISHCDCEEDAQKLKNMILERWPDLSVLINTVGAVIGSHAGPGTLAVFFIGNKRE